MKTREKIITLCEGAICIALAFVLSYFEIRIGAQGGSLEFVMIPLIIFAVYRGGAVWGLGAGMIFGTLKYFLSGGYALTWTSVILDYTIAYGVVGLAGLFKNRKNGYFWGALLGCAVRFAVHLISGVTIYAIVAPTEVLGITTSSVWLYSFLYNIAYMGFNTVAAVIISPLLGIALNKAKKNALAL